nr:Chain P, Cyclic Peptide [synthetic construct]1E4X_Q Chain Q, Cyclic Peptide [synthetic construct]
VVSHFND